MQQPDTARFAPGKKINGVLPRENQILHVKNDRPAACFRLDQRFQFGYTFRVHSTAECNDHFAVRGPVDSKQYLSSFAALPARTKASQPPTP